MLCAGMPADQPPVVDPFVPPVVVDARGLRCPWPVLRLDRALRDGAAAVDLICDDPAAAGEVPAYAGARGLDLVAIDGVFHVRRR